MFAKNPVRRKRGAVRLNCAECRRLKIRCDRTVPCSSCVKRGCSAICPDGSLTTGLGNRYVLASTEELHKRNLELAWRIRCLEDALQALWSEQSPDTHPLLSEDLLRVKIPLQMDPLSLRDSVLEPFDGERSPEVCDTLASMSSQTSPSGGSRYYGHTANSWFFLRNGRDVSGEELEESMISKLDLPPEILQRASAISLSNLGTGFRNSDFGVDNLLPYLPSLQAADTTRAIYYNHASWMYNPVPSEQFEAEIYSVFYGSRALSEVKPLGQKLSILFLVLAIGSLMDSTLSPHNVEAERYYQLARAALFQTSLFDAPSIHAVQALFLMSFYQFLADRHGTASDASWELMGMAVRVSQNIGLHRDGTLWNFDTATVQTRRVLFWEIFAFDSWQSLTFGRPTSYPLTHVDCRQPHIDVSDDEAFHAWKHRFTSECMRVLHDRAFGARGLSYSAALELDGMIRNFPVPPILNMPELAPGESSRSEFSTPGALCLQRHLVVAIREISLLYLHRSFFARAICDHPEDPLQSPYGNSIHAVFRSAQNLMAMIRNLHTQFRSTCQRMWFLWTHIFSCSIILATIVTRCPSINLAPSALHQLELACRLFSDVATGFRATKMLDIMLKLQRKAHRCLKDHQGGGGSRGHGSHHSSPGDSSIDIFDEELVMLKGNIHEEPNSTPSSPSQCEIPISPHPRRDHIVRGSIEEFEVFTAHSIYNNMSHSEISLQLEASTGGVNQPAMLAAVSTSQVPDAQSFMDLDVPLHLRNGFDYPVTSHVGPELNPYDTNDSTFSNDNGCGFDTSKMNASFPQYLNVSDHGYGLPMGGEWLRAISTSASPALVLPHGTDDIPPLDEHSIWQNTATNLRSF